MLFNAQQFRPISITASLKKTLENTKGVPKIAQSRETGNIGYIR